MTKKITLRTLEAKGACRDQCKRFAALFPEGVEVTEALCIEHAAEFNWDWAAQNLLTDSAWAEYHRTTASAWAKHDRARASAWAEHQCYERTTAPAWVKYDRVTAATFAKLYLRG